MADTHCGRLWMALVAGVTAFAIAAPLHRAVAASMAVPPGTQPVKTPTPQTPPPQPPTPQPKPGPTNTPEPTPNPAEPAPNPGPPGTEKGPGGDGNETSDPIHLYRPTRKDLDHPNLPTVLGHGVPSSTRVNSGATIISSGKQVFLITTLDALTFESGERTVDIAFVTHDNGRFTECAVISEVDSFRFRWTPAAPEHCAIELRDEEVAKVRDCKVWAFFNDPTRDGPQGNGSPNLGPRCGIAGRGVLLQDDGGRRRYSSLAFDGTLDPDAAFNLQYAPVDPAADAGLAGCSFVHDMNNGWLWLAGIGTVPQGVEPMMHVLGQGPIEALLTAMSDGSARPVTELLLLDRHFQRLGIPAGYEGMRSFMAANQLDGLVTWKVVQLARGNHAELYPMRPRVGIDGARVIAAVARDPSLDLTMRLRGVPTGAKNLSGKDTHAEKDAMVAVKAEYVRGLRPGEMLRLDISEPTGSNGQVLVIEATTTGEQSLPLHGPATAEEP